MKSMTATNFGTTVIVKSLKKDIVAPQKILNDLFSPQRQSKVKYHCLNQLENVNNVQFKIRKNIAKSIEIKLYKNISYLTKVANTLFGQIIKGRKSKMLCIAFSSKNDCLNSSQFNKIASNLPSVISKKCNCVTKYYNPTKLIHQPKSFSSNLQLIKYSTTCKESSETNDCSNHGRCNYHDDVECAMNQQILAELEACYTYLSMACYFARTNVALPGSHGFYMKMHNEEHDHALQLIKYQTMRGGNIQLYSIPASEDQDWQSITNALTVSLEMEKKLKGKLIDLHNIAEKHRDLAVMDMLVTTLIQEQDRSICEFARLLTRCRKMGGCGCSEFLFDRELFENFVKKTESDKMYI